MNASAGPFHRSSPTRDSRNKTNDGGKKGGDKTIHCHIWLPIATWGKRDG